MAGRLQRWWYRALGYRVFGKHVEVFGRFTCVDPSRVKLGRSVAINHEVFMLGAAGIEIGDGVILSARCMLVDAALDPSSFVPGQARRYANRPIVIGDGAWIGAGAMILSGVTVGANAIVGAGSVVTRDVAPGAVVAGNPARPIGDKR